MTLMPIQPWWGECPIEPRWLVTMVSLSGKVPLYNQQKERSVHAHKSLQIELDLYLTWFPVIWSLAMEVKEFAWKTTPAHMCESLFTKGSRKVAHGPFEVRSRKMHATRRQPREYRVMTS